MALKLTIDQGNTAVKTGVWRDDSLIGYDSRRELDADAIIGFADKICGHGGKFDAAIYSTVTARDERIVDAVASCSSRFIELSASTPLPLTIGYRTRETLGLDRVAAVAGAIGMAPQGAWTLVVDLGTAITYDVLSADGVFVGGNIAPGIFMRLEALNAFTARLPLVETDGDCPLWGYDTETALRAGAINGVVAEILYYRSQLPGDDRTVVLTGGSAELVAGRLDFDVTIDHNLVLKGLNSIINHNEII